MYFAFAGWATDGFEGRRNSPETHRRATCLKVWIIGDAGEKDPALIPASVARIFLQTGSQQSEV